MRTDWKYKLKLILLLPIVVLFTMGNKCGGDEDGGDSGGYIEEVAEDLIWFSPEYDRMDGYDIFPNGDFYAADVFATCSTEFSIFDDDIIAPVVVDFDTIYSVVARNAQQSEDGLIQRAYIIAIQDIVNLPNPAAWGITAFGGQPGLATSFIFVQAIRDSYPDDFSKIQYTVVHELGHLRTDLTELCVETSEGSGVWGKNPDHDHDRCVMSPSWYSPCTLYPVSNNLLFCPKDIAKIKSVTW